MTVLKGREWLLCRRTAHAVESGRSYIVFDNGGREWLVDAGDCSSLSRVRIDLALGSLLW